MLTARSAGSEGLDPTFDEQSAVVIGELVACRNLMIGSHVTG
jgi:hypothetical protein